MSRFKMNSFAVKLIGFILSFWILFLSLIRMIRVGKSKFLTVKVRETPPPCLLDPGLGRHGYVKLKDVKLHYVMNGDTHNPLMVLLHGFPEFWFSWRYQLKEFCKEYCVVAVDLRGYGDSEKPTAVEDYQASRIVEDIYQLIVHFKGENGKAVVMGHDWGGILSYYLAARHPENVSKLIVGNAPHPMAFKQVIESSWTQFLKSWYIYFFQTPMVPEFLLRTEDLAFLSRAFRNKNSKVVTPDELEAYKYIYARPGAFTAPINYYRATMMNGTPSGSSTDSHRVSVPTLLIWGDRDLALSLQTATTTSQHVDQFNLRVVEGASHWIQMERPEEFNGHAWNFLHS